MLCDIELSDAELWIETWTFESKVAGVWIELKVYSYYLMPCCLQDSVLLWDENIDCSVAGVAGYTRLYDIFQESHATHVGDTRKG